MKRFSRKVCAVTASLLGIAGCLLTIQIALRAHLAAETAEKAGQKSYAMNLHDFSDNFDENLGGTANGIAFLCLIPIMAAIYVGADNFPSISQKSTKIVKLSMGVGGFLYTFVLGIFVTGACMDTSSLDNCGDQTVDSSNPYTNCRLQDDLRKELDSVSCPSLFFYVFVSSLAWMILILSNGFDIFGEKTKKKSGYSSLPSFDTRETDDAVNKAKLKLRQARQNLDNRLERHFTRTPSPAASSHLNFY